MGRPLMGYLGYDPVALAALRRALDALEAEAATTWAGDPLAADPVAQYRAAVAAVVAWRARLDQVLACREDGLRVPSLDVRLADVAHPAVPGWSMAADTGPGQPVDAATHGARLAELVLVGLDALLADRAQAGELARALDELDPAGAAAFLTALGPERAAAVLDRLAGATALETAERPHRAHTAGVLDAIGRLLGRAWPGLDAPAWLAALGRLDPFTAGRVCSVAALPTAALAGVAGGALARWLDGGSALVMGQPLMADDLHPPRLLLDALARDPAAAREALRHVPDGDLARLLGNTTATGATAGPFLVAAVHPATASPSEAGDVLTRVLPALRDEAGLVDADLHGWLGAAVGPWLDGLVLGGVVGAAPWAWGGHDGVALLDWVARSAEAADAVAVAASALVRNRWAAVALGDRRATLYDLGTVVGTAQRAAGDGHVWVATREQAAWHRLWGTPGAVLGIVGGPAGPLGIALGWATSTGTERAAGVTEDAGWLGAPPPPERVARLALRRAGDAKIDHVAEIARFDVAEAARSAPPVPDPLALAPSRGVVAAYADALDDWVARGGPAVVRDDAHAFGDGFGDGYDRLAFTPRSGP